MTQTPDITPRLPKSDALRVLQIVGTFLHCARAVDPTMVTALSAIASQQAHATEATANATVKFLNYAATHPDAEITHYPPDMMLKIHSDASYLSEPKAHSRYGGHFYLGNKNNKPDTTNGAILNTTGILKNVMSSATEAETGGLFENTRQGAILRSTLNEMGHPQPATPVITDNSTADGITNDNIKKQCSRTIDMRFYWIRDRAKQGQFIIFWAPASINLADCFTKHHSPTHHRHMRPLHLSNATSNEANCLPQFFSKQSVLRGCVDPSAVTRMCRRFQNTPLAKNANGQKQQTTKKPTRLLAALII